MTRGSRRALLTIAAWSALAASAGLAGCGKKTEGGTAAAAPSSAPAAAPRKADPLKISFVYVSSVGDAGWSFAHDKARKELEKFYGDRIATAYIENVPEGADAERVFRDQAGQGSKLVFGTTSGYAEPILKVAPDLKDVKFEHAGGRGTAANLRTYDSRSYEGAYLAGIIAGAMTKTRTLGVVGSVPTPEVIRNIDAFTLGAQSVNPQIKTRVAWVNEWLNPAKESQAATALLDAGADVLLQNTESNAVLQAAEAAGKHAFGWYSDMSAYGPKAHLASAVVNWAPYYIKATGEVLEGKWAPGASWWGVKEGAVDIVSISDQVPADIKAKVDSVKAGLKDGSFAIWRGPIVSADGKEVLKAGVVADDKFLGNIDFYVKGVEGKVPGQ